MNKRKKIISVVLPSFNDDPIILPYYKAITDKLESQMKYDFELIYVDDGSHDGSPATLQALSESDPRVTYIELFRNYGQQRALFAGLAASKGDYVITLDGDFQYGPEVILQLVEAMSDKYDLASGIRIKRQDPPFERATSYIGNHLIQKIFHSDIKDFGSVKCFSRILVDKITSYRHCFSDVYPAALSLHPSTIEIPVEHRERPVGTSHWNLWMRLNIYLNLYATYSDSRMHLSLALGILTTLLGIFAIGAWSAYSLVGSVGIYFLPIFMLCLLVFFTGIIMSYTAIIIHYLLRIYLQNSFTAPFTIRKVVKDGKEVDPEKVQGCAGC
jgi:glycosyltransferase involved in cell wall biosynthesis